VRCGTDHGRFAVSCAGCGARLDTDEQRRANDALWATRQAEAEGEARASAERRAAVAEAAAEDARGRRSMYEELAREVGERERARLGGATSAGDAPIGLVVVRAIRDRRWKLAAVGGAGAAVLGLVGGGLAARSPAAVLAGLAIAIALVAPRGVARRRW
jgi:hypothetical protein